MKEVYLTLRGLGVGHAEFLAGHAFLSDVVQVVVAVLGPADHLLDVYADYPGNRVVPASYLQFIVFVNLMDYTRPLEIQNCFIVIIRVR